MFWLLQALGVMATGLLAVIMLRIAFWVVKQNGFTKMQAYMEARQARANFTKVSKQRLRSPRVRHVRPVVTRISRR